MTTTLLAVDDSKTIRKVLEITFAGENYRTVLADSADDALGKVRAERPAVALVDASLGATSGYDLCQQIKREAPGVAVILLSSKQAPYDRARGNSAGADDFIDKPFDTQQLIDKVGAIVRKTGDVGARPQPAPAAASAAPAFTRPRTNTLAYGTASTDVASPAPPQAAAGLGRSPGFGNAPMPTPPTTISGSAPQPAAPARGLSFTQPVGSAGQHPPAPAPVAAPTYGTAPAFPAPAARPAQPEPSPAPAPAAAKPAAAPMAALGGNGQFAEKLSGLGLTQEQIQGVLALSRDVVEKVVWEVVPVLAETLIKEEIQRLTKA